MTVPMPDEQMFPVTSKQLTRLVIDWPDVSAYSSRNTKFRREVEDINLVLLLASSILLRESMYLFIFRDGLHSD